MYSLRKQLLGQLLFAAFAAERCREPCAIVFVSFSGEERAIDHPLAMSRRRSAVLEAVLEPAPTVRPSAPSVHPRRGGGTSPTNESFTSPAAGGPRQGGEQQSRPDSRALAGDVRERQRNLEPAEKVQLLALYAMLAVDDTGRKVGVEALEASFGRAPAYITKRLMPAALAGDGFEKKERADKGVGRKLTTEVVAVRKARRGATDSFELDKLTLDVLAEYKSYPALELAKMWEYRKYVLRQIIACGGGNQYEQHRPLEVKKADEERAAKRVK